MKIADAPMAVRAVGIIPLRNKSISMPSIISLSGTSMGSGTTDWIASYMSPVVTASPHTVDMTIAGAISAVRCEFVR